MNNEKMNQMIGEAYENYRKSHTSPPSNTGGPLLSDNLISVRPIQYTREEFINKCKNNPEFSETWGLKIEERELDMMERWQLADLTPNMTEFDYCNKLCDEHNVPTKLITITYNNEKIEIYE